MRAGFIYILTNQSMPEILKIGMTSRTPMERANELFTSGVPTPFRVVFAMHSNNVREAECEIHEELSEYRVFADREFFKIDLCKAMQVVFDWCTETDHTIVESDLVMDPGNLRRYAQMCNIPLPDVCPVIDFFTDEEWLMATERFHKRHMRMTKEGVQHDLSRT